MTSKRRPETAPFGIPAWFGVCVLGSVALFFAWMEHRAHLLGALPYLLFLACPLTHLLMHRRHGDQHSHAGQNPSGGRQDRCHDEGASP